MFVVRKIKKIGRGKMKKLNMHMEKITKAYTRRDGSREVLKCVHYNKEHSRIECCDSHRLITYKSKVEKDTLINLDTLEMKTGLDYPKVEHLVPKGYDYILDIKQFNTDIVANLKKAVRAEKEDMKKGVVPFEGLLFKMSLCEEKESFVISNGIDEFSVELKIKEFVSGREDFRETYFNYKYLIELFDFMKDYAKEFLEETDVFISTQGWIRPTHFKTDKFSYTITPVRKR